MKSSVRTLVVALAASLAAPLAVRANDPVPPPNASWAGTTDIDWVTKPDGTKVPPLRVGILAYCADIAHNAGDTGLQANKRSVNENQEKFSVQALAFPAPAVAPWFLDGPFDNLGNYGGQNLVDYFAYDDGIDRMRDVQLIDGDFQLPTATQLAQNFDIVVAYTDNKCGQPIPNGIANSAATALTGFIASPGKKLVLTGFAFSTTIGLGNAIFAGGLSPLRKGGPGLAACTRDAPCPIGVCVGGCTPQGNPPECVDANGNFCAPHYEPSTATTLGTNSADFACSELLNNVRGPTSSSWATALTPASVAPGASLCFNYNGSGVPFVAINQARNIVAINAFPPDAKDVQKFWFGCVVGNAIQYLSGDTNRCPSYPFCL